MEISKKKPNFPIIPALRKYLRTYSREVKLPISYQDLLHFDYSMPIYDLQGNDTLWQSVMYSQTDMKEIHYG